jgi:homoserine acetyltransferase
MTSRPLPAAAQGPGTWPGRRRHCAAARLHPRGPFTFKSGQTIPGFTLRYETYGTLNATRDNAVLICHALSGDHHCAGWHSPSDRSPAGGTT